MQILKKTLILATIIVIVFQFFVTYYFVKWLDFLFIGRYNEITDFTPFVWLLFIAISVFEVLVCCILNAKEVKKVYYTTNRDDNDIELLK